MPAVTPWSYPIPIPTLNPPLMTYPGQTSAEIPLMPLQPRGNCLTSTTYLLFPSNLPPRRRIRTSTVPLSVLATNSSSVCRSSCSLCESHDSSSRHQSDEDYVPGFPVFPSLRPVPFSDGRISRSLCENHSLVPRSPYLTNYMFYALTHQ
jgi:hypothetical protein